MLNQISMLFGGRIAEEVFMNQMTTGASNDFERATAIARDMVTRYGMDETLGYVAYDAQRPRYLDLPGTAQGGCTASPETQERIDAAIRTIVMDAFARATAILTEHRSLLERCARELLARETLDEAALKSLTASLQPAG